MNDQLFFTPDFSEEGAIEVAPEGRYTLMVKGNPTFRRSKDNKPYLNWELVIQSSDGKRYGHIFEPTMLSGRGAFRFRQHMRALGYTNDQINKLKLQFAGPETDRGTPATLVVDDAPIEIAGNTFDALLEVEAREGYDPRNRVAKYL